MKYLKILLLIGLFFLYACNDNNEETIPTEPNLEEIRYTFKTSNVESFFTINYQLVETNETKLKVSLEPIKAYNEMLGTVTIKVYVSYMFNHVHLRSSASFSFNVENLIEKSETLNEVYTDYQIEYMEVTQASGVIKSYHDITTIDKTYTVPAFVPQHIEQFTITDIEQNQALFEEFEEILNTFSLNEDMDYLTFGLSTRQSVFMPSGTETESNFQKVQLTNHYIYYENSFEKGIIQLEQDKLFHYYMNPYRIISNKQVLDVSVIESIDDINLNLDLNSSFEDQLFVADATKMEISKIGNSYFIRGYIIDVLSPSDYLLLSQQFRSMGIDEMILHKTVILLTFEVSEDEFYMVTTMTIDIPSTVISKITSRVEMMYSFKPFEKEDITSDKYIIEPADQFEEILRETNVLEEVRQEIRANNHKYLVYLEKGQYQFIDVDDQRLVFTFYDLDENRLYLTQATTHFYEHEIFIPEDGYYYLNIHQTLSNQLGYGFYLEKRDYETTWFDEETLELGINDIHFEGAYDFVRFRIDSNEQKVLRVLSSSDEVMIYPQDHFYADYVHFFEVPVGVSYFTLVSFDELNIQLEVSEVDHTHYMTNDLSLMEEIGLESSELIVTSENLGYRYLKLIVPEKAYYTIKTIRASESFSLHNMALYDDQNKLISNWMPSGIILDVGTYYIRFSSTALALGYAFYEVEAITYQTIEFDMTTKPYTTEINSQLTRYQVDLLFESHYADFHFESEESIAIYVRGSSAFHYQILNHLREPITFVFGTNTYTRENQIFYFEPGSYYLRVYSTWTNISTTYFWLAFISNPPVDDYQVGSHIPFGQLGENIFEMTYPEDSEIIKLEVTEEDIYTFTSNINGYVTIYDESFQLVQKGTQGYLLTPGIYYVYFPNRGGSTRSLFITQT